MTEREQKTQDFYQQVLHSFEEEQLSPEAIAEKQTAWQQYNDERPSEEPQVNDFPAYFYAGFWLRMFAFIIDVLCIGALSSATIGLIFTLFHWEMDRSLYTIYGFVSVLIYLAYFIFLTKLNHGQTIGKMIFGLRVISFDETQLSWQTVCIREGVARFILQFNALCYVGYLPTIFTRRKQHLGDYFANTSVVTLNTIKAFNKEVNS